MKYTHFIFIIMFSYIFSVSFSVTADTLKMSNGDAFNGTITSMDSEYIMLDTSYGLLKFKRSLVDEGRFSMPLTPLHTSSSSSEEFKRKDLLIYLPFDGNYINKATYPYMASNNGTTLGTDTFGVSNAALQSSGSGQYVSLSTDTILNQLQSFTISFRIYLEDDNAKTVYVLSKWNTTQNNVADGKFAIGIQQGYPVVYLSDNEGRYYSDIISYNIAPFQWYEMAITFHKGTLTTYINGVEVKRSSFPITMLSTKNLSPIILMTAKMNSWDQYNIRGKLDNLAIFSEALTLLQINKFTRQ